MMQSESLKNASEGAFASKLGSMHIIAPSHGCDKRPSRGCYELHHVSEPINVTP